MSNYVQGKHAVPRYSQRLHALGLYSIGQHSVIHPCSWYVKREVAKRSTPAMAVLLSTSLAAGTLAIPLSAAALDGQLDASAQSVELAPADAYLVYNEQLGLLVDPLTGKSYDPITRILVDAPGNLAGQTIEDLELDEPEPFGPSFDFANDPTDAPAPLEDPISPADEQPVQDSQEAVGNPTVAPESEAVPEEPAASPETATVVDDGSTLQSTMTELNVAEHLLNAGWTPEMVAAALGNMYAESGSNAASYYDMSGMFHYAHEVAGGLFQWTDAGASPTELSSAGFTGLTQYAAERGVDWIDVGLQAEYFLKTWKSEWGERQTYYDAAYPDFAALDVSLSFFDETLGDDFDGDGIIDAWDDDVDGDGIPNADDPTTARIVDESIVRGKAAGAARVMPSSRVERSLEDSYRHVEELTFAFMAGYEGPAASVAHLDRRIAHALRMYPAVLALDKTREQGVLGKKAGMIIASASSMLGGAYVWAAESPATRTFDCSGLTKWCYSLVGIDLAHYSESQLSQANSVRHVDEAQPGDILWKPDHVGIYIGNGKVIEAKGVDYGIVYGDASSFTAALHFDAIDESVQ